MGFGNGILEKTEIAAQLLLDFFPQYGLTKPHSELPTTTASPYAGGSDPLVFMLSRSVGTFSNVSLWVDAATPADTDRLNINMLKGNISNVGSVIDLWFKLIETIWEFIPNFNLDGDRGYGYRCWTGWDINNPPPNNPLLLGAPLNLTYIT